MWKGSKTIMEIARRGRPGSVLSILAMMMLFSVSWSFSVDHKRNILAQDVQIEGGASTTGKVAASESRRDFLRTTPTALISGVTCVGVLQFHSTPAVAADSKEELPTKEAVTECFDFIRFELESKDGGVAKMQKSIDAGDFDGLLDFSKGYDQEFRKRRLGNAKKLLQDKEIKAKATEYANAVTFDLIGINRSCRKGQESIESANKYLQELRDDTNKFLALENTIKVQN